MSDRLHDFAKAIAVRQAAADDEVDLDVMNAIARDLGMSDEDILAARAEGQARQQRARTLRQNGLYDEAVAELEQAHAWNPLDVTVSTQLADCLVRRGRKNNSADDYARAERICLQVLRAAPADNEAAGLLQTMRMNPIADKTKASPMVLVALVAGVIVMGIAGAIAFFIF